ncbi:MAG TPA: sulfotransferase [Myxococcota bacterium]|nr:sulfotransferase [Myxococcota bacterium]
MSKHRYWRLARRWVASARDARRQREALSSLESMALFVGYRRSGHSLVGALLDAHPDVAMAHGLDVLHHVRYGFSRAQIASLILANTRERAAQGRVVTGYSYAVPGQWQGRQRRLRVIGSTRGGATARTLRERPQLAARVEGRMGVPVRWIHVVRNPFDNVATLALRGRRKDLDSALGDYLRLLEGSARLRRVVAPGRLFDLRSEDLVAAPAATLRRLSAWLGLDAPDDWVDACAGIVFDAPHRTRDDAPWTPALVERLSKEIARHPFLAGYRFDG